MLPDRRCFPSCYCSVLGEPSCAPESSQYKDTLDVFYKVTRQVGFGRLWRGTSASLALTVPTILALIGKQLEGEVLTAIEVIPKTDAHQNIWQKYKKHVNSEADLVDVVTIGIPSLSEDVFTKETIRVEYEWRPQM
ncbi:mitochondrial carrier domain-containing protein [Tanacetum coccineum]